MNSLTRNIVLTFPIVIIFLMGLKKGSLQDELDHFFKSFNKKELLTRTVIKVAFARARKKVSTPLSLNSTTRPSIIFINQRHLKLVMF